LTQNGFPFLTSLFSFCFPLTVFSVCFTSLIQQQQQHKQHRGSQHASERKRAKRTAEWLPFFDIPFFFLLPSHSLLCVFYFPDSTTTTTQTTQGIAARKRAKASEADCRMASLF